MASLVSNVRKAGLVNDACKSGNGAVRYKQRQTWFTGDGERLKGLGRYEKHLTCKHMTDEGMVTGVVLGEERYTETSGKVSVVHWHTLKFHRTSVFGNMFTAVR